MKRDVSAKEFDSYSKEKKKRYIAELLIKESKAETVEFPKPPIAIVMAGIPGAGKTEFLDTFQELIKSKGKFDTFVRIDLDQIVTIFPKYTPQSYEKFRSQGNYALARCIDLAKSKRLNTMIDGTFGGASGASIKNIERLLDSGYIVEMFFMYDKPEIAWGYTQDREQETKRGINKEGFITACSNVPANIRIALDKFKNFKSYKLSIVLQKTLRDKNYRIITDIEDVDKIINQVYNIDNIRKSL